MASDDASGSQEPPPANGQKLEASSPAPLPKKRSLPDWLDHFNSGDLKLVFRSWAAIWVATILMFIQPVLNNVGVSTFFAALVLYIVPPASILMIYLLASLSLLIGMCLGWAWGLLSMKAAMAVRPDTELASRLAAYQQAVAAEAQATQQPVGYVAKKLIYDGFLLDTRVTIIYYVFGCVFIYALARMRINNAKLILFQLFGTITIDIFLLIGPLLPSFNATLAEVLVKPGAIGIGIGAVFCLVLFPQSTSHVVLEAMEKLVRLTGASTDATRKRLADQAVHVGELQDMKWKTVGLYKTMKPALAFLPIDLSRGRWNADDVMTLHEKVRAAMSASLSLLDFHIAWIGAAKKADALNARLEATRDGAVSEKSVPKEPEIGSRQIEEYIDLMEALKTPGQSEKFDRTRESLMDTTKDVLDACAHATDLSARCIHTANSNRWFGTPSQETFDALATEITATLETVRASRASCIANTNDAVLKNHADVFDENGELKVTANLHPPTLQGIILSMVIEERILGVVNAMEQMLECLKTLIETRKTHRIWFPNRIQYVISWFFDGSLVVPISDNSADPAINDPEAPTSTDAPEDLAKEAYRRLRATHSNQGAKIRRSFISRALIGTYNWLTNPAGMYALRMVIVTIATSIPASLPGTAGFFYREKGIWGVITAQTCVLVYMADFTFSLLSRGLGTVLGGALGMVAWYIGSGLGPGNPYGLGAITAVATLILVWWRLFLPPAYLQAILMTTATFVLVVGFSYDDDHYPLYGLPGVGYTAFWKRLVTVLLGFIASLVVQIFPKPPSATKHTSKTLANTVSALSDHYALLLSHWGRPPHTSPLGAVTEDISLNVADTLLSLNPSLELLNIEVSSSPFDQKVLSETQQHLHLINQCLAKLLDVSTRLPQELQQRLGIATGLTDDKIIGQVMAVLGIVEESLRTGSPLPERLPTPLVRNVYDSWHAQHRNAILNTTLVRDENYRLYCVAMSSYLQFLTITDDLVLTLKRTLGECYVVRKWEDA